ncbi:MAG: hypothetical protein GWP14_04420 [Actinobacteria bacterium]|nr:hypothetical protein [Actinomycetota bacterium]
MDTSDLKISSLPLSVQPAVRTLAELLLDSAGQNLLSFAVFGPVLTDDFDPKRMPVRSVAVLERMDLALLDSLRSHGPRLGRRRLQAPLFMTEQYIDQSRDSFPVELLEIKRLHSVVWGKDCFGSLEFSRGDVRLQCERELKAGLIALRQGLLSAHKDTLLAPLLAAAAEQTLRILRAVLWLKDVECPRDAAAVITAAGTLTTLSLDGLKGCLSQSRKADLAQLERVYADIESLSKYVNEITY